MHLSHTQAGPVWSGGTPRRLVLMNLIRAEKEDGGGGGVRCKHTGFLMILLLLEEYCGRGIPMKNHGAAENFGPLLTVDEGTSPGC